MTSSSVINTPCSLTATQSRSSGLRFLLRKLDETSDSREFIPVTFRCQPGGKQNSVGGPIFADPPVQTFLDRSFSHYIQVNIWNFIYLNRGEWSEDMIDHRSYAYNLSSCENKIQAWTGFEPVTSAILVQCSTNWAIEPSGSRPLCELVLYHCWS